MTGFTRCDRSAALLAPVVELEAGVVFTPVPLLRLPLGPETSEPRWVSLGCTILLRVLTTATACEPEDEVGTRCNCCAAERPLEVVETPECRLIAAPASDLAVYLGQDVSAW